MTEEEWNEIYKRTHQHTDRNEGIIQTSDMLFIVKIDSHIHSFESLYVSV